MFYLEQYKWWWLLCLVLLFIPYFYLCAYTNPVADDFIYGQRGQQQALVSQAVHEYFHWSGRYTANVLQFLNPLAFHSFIGYKIFPAVLICFTILSNFFFLHAFIGKQLSVIKKLLSTLLLVLLFLNQMPILSEGIYWYAGSVVYQLGNCCAMIYVALLYQYTQNKVIFKNKFIHISLLSILLLVCIGFNEIMMLGLGLFSLICLFVSYKNKLPCFSLFFYLMCLTLVCSAISFFAPGNSVRAGFAINNYRFLNSLFMATAQTIRFFLEWISSIPLLLLSFLYYYVNEKFSDSIIIFKRSFYLTPRYSIVFLFLVIFIAVFPPYWATGILGQHRTLNVAYHLFLITWFINLTVFYNLLKKEFSIELLKPRFYVLLMSIVLIALVFTKNGYHAMTDIFYGKASAYNQQMIMRYEKIKAPADTIYFDAIKDPPQSLFLYDVTKDPRNWLNIAYTLYFDCEGKSIIRKDY